MNSSNFGAHLSQGFRMIGWQMINRMNAKKRHCRIGKITWKDAAPHVS